MGCALIALEQLDLSQEHEAWHKLEEMVIQLIEGTIETGNGFLSRITPIDETTQDMIYLFFIF